VAYPIRPWLTEHGRLPTRRSQVRRFETLLTPDCAPADTPTAPGAVGQRDGLEEASARLPARLAWLTAGFPRPRFVDREGAASDVRAVEGVNGAVRRAAHSIAACWMLSLARPLPSCQASSSARLALAAPGYLLGWSAAGYRRVEGWGLVSTAQRVHTRRGCGTIACEISMHPGRGAGDRERY
jgi:hypothetical protein